MEKTMRIVLVVLFLLGFFAVQAGAQTMATYSWQPPVVTDASKPNTLILLSNDWTGFTRGYKNDNFYDDASEYWGYFDSNKYYQYVTQGQKGTFKPVGWLEAGSHMLPAAVAGGNYWSGNFLNWVAMSNVDFLRKALTGGARELDSVGNTTLLRGLIASGEAWKKNHNNSTELSRLVPPAYANGNYEFYNINTTFTVRNKSNSSTIAGPFNVEVQVCVMGMLEENCKEYPAVKEAKPEGLLHKYADKMRFGLMTYSHAMAADGGVLRKRMGDVRGEWQYATNGQQNQGINDTMIRYIENYTRKGWDPLAEMYYDAVRYFKGNKGASQAYCAAGNFTADDSFPVYGCESNKDWGDDPIIDWCQKNNIIIMNDEYPSQEHNYLPGSAFNTTYAVSTFAGGNDHPYTINVSDETKAVGDWEKNHNSTNTNWFVGNILGGLENQDCSTPKTVTDLSKVHGICPTEPNTGTKGTFYLAGIAHHAFTHDLRSDHEGTQNIRTWTLAYRATSNSVYFPPTPPMNQMWLAAKYGNFDDLNGNGMPDDAPINEWADPDRVDNNNNPLPYAYYSADSGKQLVDAIGKIFDAILETTASGTAVSVLANSGQGEGNLVQAYYRPRLSLGEESVDWIGFLQSLWIDGYGYIREDTVSDKVLNPEQDRVVRYVETTGTTKAHVYTTTKPDGTPNPYPNFATDAYTEVELEEVKVLFDSGRLLAQTDPMSRKIFTYVDKDQDHKVAERLVANPNRNVFDDSGEVIRFYDRNYRALMPYLNVEDSALNAYLGRSQKIRALNLVRWTQGYDQEVNANRFVDLAYVDTRGRSLDGTTVFKLGDVINSTPVTIAAPPDNYHVIYSDESYQAFYNQYKDRETVVYVGANDGMLHAFTSWRFDKELLRFVDPDPSTTESIGGELWAYIPQNLLPHLKWLPRTDYTHVYYVDMQPRIFDARIFLDASGNPINPAKHPNGWGTILVGGYGIGGGHIWVNDVFDDGSGGYNLETRNFNPSYFAIDITNPREPELLWDRSFEGLGMSWSFPTIMRTDGVAVNPADRGIWRLVFGSGPDAGDRSLPVPPQYDGESGDPANFYVVDVLTGTPVQSTDSGGVDHDYLFQTDPAVVTNAFVGPPVTFDKKLNYNVDAAYFPVTYDAGTSANHDWRGAIYKMTVPWQGSFSGTLSKEAQYGVVSGASRYSSDPNDATFPWTLHRMVSTSRPITAAPSLSIDHLNNTWVYFGTGRMFEGDDDNNTDFGSTDIEYLYGIKDPFFNRDYDGSSYMNYTLAMAQTIDGTAAVSPPTLPTPTNLFDADPIVVLSTGQVYTYNGVTYTPFGTTGYWNELVTEALKYNGWRRSLRTAVDDGGQTRTMRSLNKPSVIGGLSLFSTFMPTGNTCSFGGESDLNILYYLTGTAYRKAVVSGTAGINSIDVNNDGTTETEIKDSISLGSGTTSSVGIHIGRQNDKHSSETGSDPEGDMVTGFVQQGTGKVVEINIETALKIRSGLRAWREKQ